LNIRNLWTMSRNRLDQDQFCPLGAGVRCPPHACLQASIPAAMSVASRLALFSGLGLGAVLMLVFALSFP
jgi:hypothetical protein